LAERYLAVWNETDAGARRMCVSDLWADDAVQLLEPPREVRDAADALGVTALFEARGHAALEARVSGAYEQFVASGEFLFRRRGAAARLRDVVTFGWEMLPVGGGEATGGGLEVLVLDDDGRIRIDYQFIDP